MVEMLRNFRLFWSPEGRPIATVQARTAQQAIKQTPKPYNRYKGEVYAEPGDLVINCFIIDMKTHDVKRTVGRLSKLKTTYSAEDNGAYRQDPMHSQILLSTSMSEAEVDDWLYRNNFDYVGVVEQ